MIIRIHDFWWISECVVQGKRCRFVIPWHHHGRVVRLKILPIPRHIHHLQSVTAPTTKVHPETNRILMTPAAQKEKGWGDLIQKKNDALIQRYVPGGIPLHVPDVQAKESPSGKGLPKSVKGKMESSFGTDFSTVQLHTDSSQARELGALAYTQGENIHFASGQFDTGSQQGQALLGHELTHVVQQRQGRVQPTVQAKGLAVNDDRGLEKEADEWGAKAARGEGIEKGKEKALTNNLVAQCATHPVSLNEDGLGSDGSYFTVNARLEILTQRGTKKEVDLPDGDTVTLPASLFKGDGSLEGTVKGKAGFIADYDYDESIWPFDGVDITDTLFAKMRYKVVNGKVVLGFDETQRLISQTNVDWDSKGFSYVQDLSGTSNEEFLQEIYFHRATAAYDSEIKEQKTKHNNFSFGIGDAFKCDQAISTKVDIELNGEDILLILTRGKGKTKVPYKAGSSAMLDGLVDILKKQKIGIEISQDMSNSIHAEIEYSYSNNYTREEATVERTSFEKYGKVAGKEVNNAIIIQDIINPTHESRFEQEDQVTLSTGEKNFLDSFLLSNLHEISNIAADPRGMHKIGIEGYASSSGTTAHDIDISKKRALAVMEYLASNPTLLKLNIRLQQGCFMDIKYFGKALAMQGTVYGPDRKVVVALGTI